VWTGRKLTSSQKVEAVAEIALVASKQKSAITDRRLHGFLVRADLRSVRDTAADDDSVVVFEIGPGPHLAGVGREGTFVMRLAGLVVEVVGLVQRGVIVVVRVFVDRSSVPPAAHEEGSELFGWLGVVGGDWGLEGFCLEPAGERIRRDWWHESIDGCHLLVELGDFLLEFSDNQEAAVCRPLGLAHGVAVMSAKDQSGRS
jgi:hypothetical protein